MTNGRHVVGHATIMLRRHEIDMQKSFTTPPTIATATAAAAAGDDATTRLVIK